MYIASASSGLSGVAGVKLDKLSVCWSSRFAVKLMLRFVSYETQDGLYDLAWSEVHENQLVTASGDGSLKLWDVTLNVSTHPLIPSLGRR